MPLRRTRQAEIDLMEIWHYVSQNNAPAADRLLRDIDAKCALLLERPQIGKTREEIGPGIRSFPYRRYLVLYRIIAEGVEIVRVVHGARQLEGLLG